MHCAVGWGETSTESEDSTKAVADARAETFTPTPACYVDVVSGVFNCTRFAAGALGSTRSCRSRTLQNTRCALQNTLHYATLHYTALHYTTLHDTPRHSTDTTQTPHPPATCSARAFASAPPQARRRAGRAPCGMRTELQICPSEKPVRCWGIGFSARIKVLLGIATGGGEGWAVETEWWLVIDDSVDCGAVGRWRLLSRSANVGLAVEMRRFTRCPLSVAHCAGLALELHEFARMCTFVLGAHSCSWRRESSEAARDGRKAGGGGSARRETTGASRAARSRCVRDASQCVARCVGRSAGAPPKTTRAGDAARGSESRRVVPGAWVGIYSRCLRQGPEPESVAVRGRRMRRAG